MTLLSVLFWLVIVWWMVFFMILPIGFGKTGHEKITAFGAPINPLVLKKVLLTTIITFTIVLLIWLVNSLGWIDVADWVVPKRS